jgi:HD-GYP domain-containing protein (c-di-GMP phosphodiesterase class II)
VADAYDAMTDDRPYHIPLSQDAALAEIRKNSGQHFDPLVVDVFCTILGTRFLAPQWIL